jgi:hypothetical protein
MQQSGTKGEGGGSPTRNRVQNRFLVLKNLYIRRPVAAGRHEAQGASDIGIHDDGCFLFVPVSLNIKEKVTLTIERFPGTNTT